MTVLLVLSMSPAAFAQTVVWGRQFGSPTSDRAFGVATDSSDEYVVGTTSWGTTDSNGFLSKFDPSGALQYEKAIVATGGGLLAVDANAVAVDSSGVYVGGQTRGLLGGKKHGTVDAFVRRFTLDGDVLWTRQFGESNGGYAVYGLTIRDGMVYATGNAGPYDTGQRGMFLRKFDQSGHTLWMRQFGSGGTDWSHDVTTDARYVYVTGSVYGKLGKTWKGLNDIFVRAYTFAGAVAWTRQLGGTKNDEATGIASDGDGTYVVGYKQVGATFATLLFRFASTGTRQWTSPALGNGKDVVVLAGSEYVVGTEPTNSLPNDISVQSFASDGTPGSEFTFGSTGTEYATGCGSQSGQLVIAGFTGGLMFPTYVGAGDAFLAIVDTT
jgi:hypothetical protein